MEEARLRRITGKPRRSVNAALERTQACERNIPSRRPAGLTVNRFGSEVPRIDPARFKLIDAVELEEKIDRTRGDGCRAQLRQFSFLPKTPNPVQLPSRNSAVRVEGHEERTHFLRAL